jgi:ApaG protein
MVESKRYEITVSPKVTFLAEQSDPDKNHFVFAYTITVTNTGSVAAQLVSRHWVITDADQRVQEVKGQGVVGKQPVLKPGESFEYTSGTSIATPVGTMCGSYQMLAEDGLEFDVPIASFTLSIPRTLH